MAYGIGQEIEDLTELGVDELTRRQSINPQLKYALALQEASNLINAAARERDISMEQEEPPQVIGQLEQSLAQRLTPGVEQMIQQQPQQPQQPMMQQGVSGVPAPNMMMSGGGIVSFANGGELVEGLTEVGQQAIGRDVQPIPALMDKYGSDMVTRFLEREKFFRDAESHVAPENQEAFERDKRNFYSNYPIEFVNELFIARSGGAYRPGVRSLPSGGIAGFGGPMAEPAMPRTDPRLDRYATEDAVLEIEREKFYGPPGSGQVFYGPPVEPQLSPDGRRGVVHVDNITDQSFGDAFKFARDYGLDTFTWQGKEYHTKYPEEMARGGILALAGPQGSYIGANNPYNLRDYNQNWDGQAGATRGFVDFEDEASGVRAADKLLENYQSLHGISTVREVIARFAPPNENITEEYIEFVAKRTGFTPDQPIDLSDSRTRDALLGAMGTQESGYAYDENILAGTDRARPSSQPPPRTREEEEAYVEAVYGGDWDAYNATQGGGIGVIEREQAHIDSVYGGDRAAYEAAEGLGRRVPPGGDVTAPSLTGTVFESAGAQPPLSKFQQELLDSRGAYDQLLEAERQANIPMMADMGDAPGSQGPLSAPPQQTVEDIAEWVRNLEQEGAPAVEQEGVTDATVERLTAAHEEARAAHRAPREQADAKAEVNLLNAAQRRADDAERDRLMVEGMLGKEVLAEADVPQSYDPFDPTNERFRQAAGMGEGGTDKSGFSIDGVKAALVNLLGLDRRQPETETFTDEAGTVYPIEELNRVPTDAERMRQAFPQWAARSDAEQEAGAEAEMDLLDTAQGRANDNVEKFLSMMEQPPEARPSDTEYFHMDDQLSALATGQDRSDLTDAERMRQAFPQWAASAEQQGDAPSRTPLEQAIEDERAARNALVEFNRESQNMGADAIFDSDISGAIGTKHDSLQKVVREAERRTQLLRREEERLQLIARLEEAGLPVDPKYRISLLSPGEGGAPTIVDEEVVRREGEPQEITTDYAARAAEAETLGLQAPPELTTPTGSQYTIKSPPTGGAPGSASSIQGRYDQLTQPQSGSEAFFDLLKTLGGGGGRSEGYEFAGISERGAELDAARREEAMGIIDAETRQRAIDAQGQTDQRRFVQYYIEANRGPGKTDAQLGVEASQIYLRANNIYAGQTNRIDSFTTVVMDIMKNPTDPLVTAHRQAVNSHGAESEEATAAMGQILRQAERILETGRSLPGV